MKRIAILLASLLMLAAACGEKPGPAPITPPSFTAETFPRLDGSTANIPLAQALAKLCLGFDDLQAEDFVTFNATSRAYENLAKGACDLLLVYEASEETQAKLATTGADFDYTPIGLDALVFIVNEKNPVQSLTPEQLVGIYTGKITRWSEVGGEDLEITAFQRNAASGSQALMEKLVMQGVPMMDAPTEFVPSEMGELIDRLGEYDNGGGAIGYSVYYYASLMYSRPGLKFVGVGGVQPSNESIAARDYPYTNAFYAVLRADEPQDSPARVLARWLRGADGRALIEQCGYVPAPAES